MGRDIGVIGGQWGDEGKGNYLSVLALDAAERIRKKSMWYVSESSHPVTNKINFPTTKPLLFYRWPGGPNAANSWSIGGKIYKLRQVLGGLLLPDDISYNLNGEQMYVNPRKLVEEIKSLQKQGIKVTPESLGLDSNIHMILDYHIDGDQEEFNKARHTSTGNGIKEVARDKYFRTGIRFGEFLNQEVMEDALRSKKFPDGMPEKYGSHSQFIDSYSKEREFLAEFLTQEHVELKRHGYEHKIAVGAHGVMLDINAGMYPGITSSHPASVPRWAETVVGIFKMYPSSVGAGDRAFVSRMEKELEDTVREAWGERGTGTGKDRDLGWFDLVQARYAIAKGDIDHLVGTCGDRLEILSQLGVKPKIVVAYEVDGKRYERWHVSFNRRDVLHRAKPIFEEFDAWERFAEEDGQTLTKNSQIYTDFIQSELGRKFIAHGNGADGPESMIIRGSPFDL
jgi:adenylosuccinate synthase